MENRGQKSIKLWMDNWCHQKNLIHLLGHIPAKVNIHSTVSEFITNNHRWDIGKLNFILPHSLTKLVTNNALPIYQIEDDSCHGLSGNGNFSTKITTCMCHCIDR